MGRRRWLIRGLVLACAVVAGLGIGRMLADPQPAHRAAGPQEPGPAGRSNGADPTSGTEQASGDVVVTASMTVTDPAVGAPLIAPRQLASQTPPATVRDCRTFADWAYSAGAARTGTVLHTLSIRTGRTARVVLDQLWAQQLPVTARTRRPTVEEQLVRLHCRTEPGSRPVQHDESYDLAPVTTVAADHVPPDGSFYMTYVFDLNAGGEATLTVPVEPIYGPWQYDYVLRGVVLIDGARHEFTTGAGDAPFRWSEDLAGMGYIPAQHYWTLLPTPRLVRCPEIVLDPATRPAPSCGPE